MCKQTDVNPIHLLFIDMKSKISWTEPDLDCLKAARGLNTLTEVGNMQKL